MKGFTLIEMMVVVALIGIVAMYAMPNFQGSIIRAQVNEGIALVEPLQDTVLAFHRQNGRFPLNNDEAGLPAADHVLGNYVTRVTLTDGALHIEFGNHVNRTIGGRTLTLMPQVVDGSPASPVSWQCGLRTPPPGMRTVGENRTDIPVRFLPMSCM